MAVGREIISPVPNRKAPPEGSRMTGVPKMLSVAPSASNVLPPTARKEGLPVNVWPLTVYTDGSVAGR